MSEINSQADSSGVTVPKIEDAAKALAKHLDIQVIPRPPGFLIRSYLDGAAVLDPSRDNPPAPVIELVAPHWNHAVKILDEPQGYLTLTTMRDRLAEQLRTAKAARLPYDTSQVILGWIADVVGGEAERHGSDSPVRHHLDGRIVIQIGRGWRWVKEADHAYRLDLAGHKADPLWRESGHRMRPAGEAFTHESWGDVVHRIIRLKEDLSQQSMPIRREVAVLTFRLSVIDQVLREREALGHVGELMPGDQRRVERVIPEKYQDCRRIGYRLLLVVLAHEEIRQDPEQSLTVNTMLSGPGGQNASSAGGIDLRAQRVIEEAALDFGEGEATTWGQGKARRYAEEEPIRAYLDKDALKSAGYKKATRGDRRRHFDERIAELYSELADAGFATVDDIASFYRAGSR